MGIENMPLDKSVNELPMFLIMFWLEVPMKTWIMDFKETFFISFKSSMGCFMLDNSSKELIAMSSRRSRYMSSALWPTMGAVIRRRKRFVLRSRHQSWVYILPTLGWILDNQIWSLHHLRALAYTSLAHKLWYLDFQTHEFCRYHLFHI